MVIFPLAPDQIIAQMWSNGARGGASIMSLTMSFGEPWLQRTPRHRRNHQVSHVATVRDLTLIPFKAVNRSFGTSLWQPHWPSHTWTQLPSERVWWP